MFPSTYQRQTSNNNTNNSHLIELCKLDIICDFIEELTRIDYDCKECLLYNILNKTSKTSPLL